MKKIFSLLLIVTVFSSCKKDKGEPKTDAPITSASSLSLTYFPMTIGSYWVYQNVRIDTLGNETITSTTDTVKLVGDTIINGNTYFVFNGSAWLNIPASMSYYRDSSGYLVTPSGRAYFAQYALGTTLWTDSVPSYTTSYYKMKTGDSTITVPSGTYVSLVAQEWIYFTNHSYPWGSPRIDQFFYADGIGKIKERNFFYGASDYFEGRLITYYIAP